jgi:hypothetical protein
VSSLLGIGHPHRWTARLNILTGDGSDGKPFQHQKISLLLSKKTLAVSFLLWLQFYQML